MNSVEVRGGIRTLLGQRDADVGRAEGRGVVPKLFQPNGTTPGVHMDVQSLYQSSKLYWVHVSFEPLAVLHYGQPLRPPDSIAPSREGYRTTCDGMALPAL